MHIINEAQKRSFIEVIQAASDMLDLMDEAPPNQWDDEWREAVRESIHHASWLVRDHHIYISKKEG